MNQQPIFYSGLDILRTDISGPNTILAQTGDAVSGSSPEPAEWWQQIGFASRPTPVSGSGKNADAAQAIVIVRTDYNLAIASRDTRFQDIYGALKPGETCLYATGTDGKAQARILLKQNGSLNLFTKKGNVESGAGMGIFIDPITDQISIVNSKGFGIIISEDGIIITSKGGALKLTESGEISLIGKSKVQIDGTNIVLGALVAPTVPSPNAALVGISGIAGVPSQKVLIAIS